MNQFDTTKKSDFSDPVTLVKKIDFDLRQTIYSAEQGDDDLYIESLADLFKHINEFYLAVRKK